MTLIPGLVEAVKQVLLLAWAFAESVLDVRLLLNGKRVAFQKDAATWKLSLSGALELEDLSGLDEAEDADGLLYRDYLGILLTLTGREKRILRSLDAIEGVVRETDGQWFYVDQCIDAFLIRTVVNGGQNTQQNGCSATNGEMRQRQEKGVYRDALSYRVKSEKIQRSPGSG